jgi:hypothetical protein
MSKKLVWVFAIFIVLPNIVFWGSPVLERFIKDFSVTDYNNIFIPVIFLPIIGSVIMLGYSIKYKNYLSIGLSVILLIATTLIYMAVYSLSNFGF